MMPPTMGQGQQGGQDFGKMNEGMQEKQQEEMQARMLRGAQKGVAQMGKSIAAMEKRIAGIEKKSGVISSDLKNAVEQAKDLMAKAKAATTMDDFQAVGLENMWDVMQTINEEMQKAEMSTQFPGMMKQANRMLSQQQKALKSAQKKADSLKISVDSLLIKWQQSVESMSQSISQAQESFRAGNTMDAIDILQQEVFGAMQDIGNNQQVFEMISNSQKMLKMVEKEVISFEKKIAALKKRGKDTSDAESALLDVKAKIDAVKEVMAETDVSADTIIDAIQDAVEAKEALYEAMAELTGQNYGVQGQSIPDFNFQQFQAPSSLEQFFTKPEGGQHERNFPQSGPQSLNNPVKANSQVASAILAAQKQIEELKKQIEAKIR